MKTTWRISCETSYCEIGRSIGGLYHQGPYINPAVDGIRVSADEIGGDGHYEDWLRIWTTDDKKEIESVVFDYDGEPEASFREWDYDDACEALAPVADAIEGLLGSVDVEEASRKTLDELKQHNPTMQDIEGREYGVEDGNYWDYLEGDILDLLDGKTITVDLDVQEKTMTYKEHVRDCSLKEAELLKDVIDMIERNLNKELMLTSLNMKLHEIEQKAGRNDGEAR